MTQIVLGIESSCDETAAAVVDSERNILSNVVLSQIEEHAPYGGVVPEIAARAHIDHLDRLIAEAMAEARVDFDDLDAVAATAGPGLIGGVMIGLVTAKAICTARDKPLIGLNHLEAHALTARLTNDVAFPYLLLLVSGGHCQLVSVTGVNQYKRLGTTLDDAVGEAFDKAAKMMGLGYPGGPLVEIAARKGDASRFKLPRPMKGRDNCDFSFSGLKTAVRRALDSIGDQANDQDHADLCASFQAAVGDVLADRTKRAMGLFEEQHPGARRLVIAGGVAANKAIGERLSTITDRSGFDLIVPPLGLCTDNAAMVAWAGLERLKLGLTSDMTISARARWPLDSLAGATDKPFTGAKA
ncbi:MAG: tRNA (adenosine(37)-N6)-threonylcarbamoyltransferase complex transferase subunit TsaD [Alphaproteobacteria bacterium]|nr:tRNA (adenosine(37)-N6)-threonylcarbamoyltransferase complex transferase subunit TsaD [Alphaproteobacteria bacterium]MBT6384870.1 tRNA (adenosine(37)-N6)-threonylcarbamoyltransferase complex transferase subunit TsaD [Alphaproteobacteria bacterium]